MHLLLIRQQRKRLLCAPKVLAKCAAVFYLRVLTHTTQPFYEDFPFTIECLRLTLLNSKTLTPRELSKFTRITEQGSQMCIRIFVRHAVRHGPYLLSSLGPDPSPDFPRPQQTGTVQPASTQPSAPADRQAPAPAASHAQLAGENATMRRQMNGLNVRADRVEGHRGVGRSRATPTQTDRPSQPRGGYNGRPDRGYHANQGAFMPPAVQQTPSQYSPSPFDGYNRPYGGSPHMPSPYPPAAPMGGYGMQQYQQQFGDPPQQSYGAWSGNQTYHTTQQANSSQSGAYTAYTVPPPQTALVPQQIRGSNQRQPAYGAPGPSEVQQTQLPVQAQGASTLRQEQASAPRTTAYVPNPYARPFTPGAASHYSQITIQSSH